MVEGWSSWAFSTTCGGGPVMWIEVEGSEESEVAKGWGVLGLWSHLRGTTSTTSKMTLRSRTPFSPKRNATWRWRYGWSLTRTTCVNNNARFSLFFFFLFNLPSPPNECHGVANTDIIVKRLKKEIDLRNGILKTAKKRKRNNPAIATARKLLLPLPTVRRTYSCAGVIPTRSIIRNRGLFTDD